MFYFKRHRYKFAERWYLDEMIDTYNEDLKNIDKDTEDFPQCMKVEKETVLRNLIKVLSYLKTLKK